MKQITSQVETVKAQAEKTRIEVLNVLGWDELQYCEFQEQQGREYISIVLCTCEFDAVQLGNSKFFWRWWVNQWNRRDDDFLNNPQYHEARESFGDVETYEGIHSPEFLQGYYPHRVLFEESYSTMIGVMLDAK